MNKVIAYQLVHSDGTDKLFRKHSSALKASEGDESAVIHPLGHIDTGKTCLHCGSPMSAGRSDKVYCGKNCKVYHHLKLKGTEK